jgi:hypothetical protein
MNEGQLIKLPCACKNLPIHPGCLKEWLKSCPDILQCGVCKMGINPSFIEQFVNVEDLWNYPYKLQRFYPKTYIAIPGIKDVEIVNDEYVFNDYKHKTLFFEATKKKYLSERHSKKQYETSRKNIEWIK